MIAGRICIQCFRREGDPTPWCESNPGDGCLYGLDHLYEEAAPTQPVRKRDAKRCIKCDLHPKNPASLTNGCAHEYESTATTSPQ